MEKREKLEKEMEKFELEEEDDGGHGDGGEIGWKVSFF